MSMTTTLDLAPPLESGDHLPRDEFHRRYCAHPEIRKAELIEGVVFVPPFAVSASHADPHALVITWLGSYKARTPGLFLADNGTFFMNDDSEVQPDAALFRAPPSGNVRDIFVRDRDDARPTRYRQGAPELIAEIAASSASIDLHRKKRVYERAGVSEYIVWQVWERRIDWFRLVEGVYEPLEPDARGVIESVVFPGLRLHVAAMLAGDDAAVLAELEAPAPPPAHA